MSRVAAALRLSTAQRAADWNQRYPVGSRVRIQAVTGGPQLDVRTLSEATGDTVAMVRCERIGEEIRGSFVVALNCLVHAEAIS